MLLHCGLANRLFTIDSNIENTKCTWVLINGTSFSDLFRLPSFEVHNTVDRAISRILPRIRRNVSAKSCCLCSDLRCGRVLGYIQPHPNLRPPLDALRKRMGMKSSAFHWRNSDEKNIYGKQSYKFNQMQFPVQRTFAYVAVQREQDARFIRRNFPSILLQQDFRNVTWGRNTRDGLLAAVFDMFALSMSAEIQCSTRSSTFCRVAKCLRYQSELPRR